MTMEPRYTQQKATIPLGETTSNYVDCLGYRLVGFYVPANMDGTTLLFRCDPLGDLAIADCPYAYNRAGEEIIIVMPTVFPCYVSLDEGSATNLGRIPPCARMAVESNITSTPEAEAAEVTITLVFEKLPN